MKKKLLLSVGVFAICLILMEIALRLAAPGMRRHYFTPIDPETGIGYTGGHPYSYNRYGMREIEFPSEKPDDEIRVLCIGDSVTFGYGLPYEQSWPKVLEERLNAESQQRKYFCINSAGVGSDTHQQLAWIRKHPSLFGADTLIVGFNMSDVMVKNSDTGVGDKINTAGARLSDWVEFRYYLRSSYVICLADVAITNITKRYIVPLFTSDHWALSTYPCYFDSLGLSSRAPQAWEDTLQSLRELRDETTKAGAELVMVAFPYQIQISDDARDDVLSLDRQSFTIDPCERLEEFCRKERIAFINLLPALAEKRERMIRSEEEWNNLYLDFCHLNREGLELSANVIRRQLENRGLIREPAPPNDHRVARAGGGETVLRDVPRPDQTMSDFTR